MAENSLKTRKYYPSSCGGQLQLDHIGLNW